MSDTSPTATLAPPGRSSDAASSSSSAHFTPDADSDDGLEVTGPLDELSGIPLKRLSHDEVDRGAARVYDEEEDDSQDDSDSEDGFDRRKARRASVQSFELYTPDEERAVIRKLDRKLVLFVALLYMLSFLDRSNIGNAKVAGMAKDLGLDDSKFDLLLSSFYVTYVLFEWMTLLYRVFPAHIYIACCVAAWGLIASLQAVSTGFASMLIFRLALGISEAAFGPGIPFYLSFFFKRDELAYRTGLFISAAPLASSFASTLAYGIMSLGNKTSIQSWRLLFLVEGFPSLVVAVWCWYWIPDSPATARWLNGRDRKIATIRLRQRDVQEKVSSSGTTNHKTRLDWKEIGKTFADPKSYLTAAMFFSCNISFASMPVFEPIIINAIGYSPLAAQGLTALPHLFAFFVVLLTAFLSDRFRSRSIPIMIVALTAMSGYTLLALARPLALPSLIRYLALFPITAGFFSAVTLVIVWTMDNQHSAEGKGTGVALLNVIGQVGSLSGTRLYPEADGPFYIKGYTICACFMAMIAILAVVLRVVLKKANRKAQLSPEYSRLGHDGDSLIGERASEQKSSSFAYML